MNFPIKYIFDSFVKDEVKRNNNKKVILIDDEDLLFTYKFFLKDDYDVTTFIDPSMALNYIRAFQC